MRRCIAADETGMTAALCWGIPTAIIAWAFQGIVAIFFDLGLLYPLIGYTLGSTLRTKSPGLHIAQRQTIAMALTYLAVALSPLIPFGNAIGFEPIRMRNAAIGAVISFVPLMISAGVVGVLNTGLLFLGLRQAWGQSRVTMPANG